MVILQIKMCLEVDVLRNVIIKASWYKVEDAFK